MDTAMNAHSALAYAAWLLVQLLSALHALYLPLPSQEEKEDDNVVLAILDDLGQPIHDPHAEMTIALHNFRLCTSLNVFDDDLGFRVKPQSTTWFSRFLLHEYDDNTWIQMFRFTKPTVFALADILRPTVQKKDTKYRLAIPVVIRVACCLFKLTHGASLFICSEMFAIGRSTMSSILRDVVHSINDTLGHELSWPRGAHLHQTQENFYNLCGLPGVAGAIDGTHIAIAKPQLVPADYFYFKSGGYTLNSKAVVDSQKRFLDLYLGMPGSTNDSRMLRRSSLHHLVVQNQLFDEHNVVQGFSPYLIGDLDYPLLPWLMVPHRCGRQLSLAEVLFNKKLRRGQCVVENTFGILKQTFREVLKKSDLHVAFLPDAILACAILHNMLLGQSHEDVENLLEVLRAEGLDGEIVDGTLDFEDGPDVNTDAPAAAEKREDLGMFLSMQRMPQH